MVRRKDIVVVDAHVFEAAQKLVINASDDVHCYHAGFVNAYINGQCLNALSYAFTAVHLHRVDELRVNLPLRRCARLLFGEQGLDLLRHAVCDLTT